MLMIAVKVGNEVIFFFFFNLLRGLAPPPMLSFSIPLRIDLSGKQCNISFGSPFNRVRIAMDVDLVRRVDFIVTGRVCRYNQTLCLRCVLYQTWLQVVWYLSVMYLSFSLSLSLWSIRPEWYETQQRRPFPEKGQRRFFVRWHLRHRLFVNNSNHFVVTIGTDTRKQQSTALHCWPKSGWWGNT